MKWLLHVLLISAVSVVAAPVEIGSRRELMIDDFLIEKFEGEIGLRLHNPNAKEVVLVHDAPWEGTGSGYHSIFKDGDFYRMYYKSVHIDLSEGKLNTGTHPRFCSYAESKDGIHWEKPILNLHEFNGSKENNITITSDSMGQLNLDAAHPAIFKDSNPEAPKEALYKAILRSREPNGLIVLKSANGLSWSPFIDRPILRLSGAFDSQNLAFWDPHIQMYRAYWRTFPDGIVSDTEWKPKGNRSISTGVSADLKVWEELTDLVYEDSYPQQMYTNGIHPYHRATHILIGFPTRYLERANTTSMEALPDSENRKIRAAVNSRYGHALSEGLFMSSRNGTQFKRWNEAFLRPGPERPGTWLYGSHYLAWGLIETESDLPGAGKELSLYAQENYWHGAGTALRRYTLRLDGFVSASANWEGGKLITKPLTFTGNQLNLNFATSAAGHIRVEIQSAEGDPIPGFSIEDCPHYFGDSVAKKISWNNQPDLGALAEQPVKIMFELKNADLYAFRFQ